MFSKNSFLVLLLFISLGLQGQQKSWDVTNPGSDFKYKKHQFSTQEGTWMNLDVSPDGSTLLFDLLGDIYSLPIDGGTATPLRQGIAFEIQPRFSPDGKQILFTSDAGGGDNIWVMQADGTQARQLTTENFRLLNNAVWMPDGNYIVARKHFTSGRSMGAGEMWQYHISGGSGVQLTKRRTDQKDVNEPTISPDGKYMYYSEDVTPGSVFEYNKDPNGQIYAIQRYDFETGEIKQITGGPGSAARPQISRDGKLLAFIKRVRTQTVLYIHNLETGEEWPVFDQLNKDQMTAWALFGVYPNFSWMPNHEEIVIWAKGKIFRVNIYTSQAVEIPFQVNVSIDLAERVFFENPIEDSQFEVQVIRDAVTSPQGDLLVFRALGYLWKKELPNGTPVRLTQETDLEAEPSFSADGKSIVFVSWNDLEMGKIKMISLETQQLKTLTQEKGIYRTPALSSDGKTLVYTKESGNQDQGYTFTKNPGIYTMNLETGDTQFITEEGEYPTFSADGKRIFFQTGGVVFGSITKELKSVDRHGKDLRTHIRSKYANRLVPSPDNQWIAFNTLFKAYIAPLNLNGQTLDLDNQSTFVPVHCIAEDAAINLHWSPQSDQVYWTLGGNYYYTSLEKHFDFLNQDSSTAETKSKKNKKSKNKSTEESPVQKLPIGLQAPVDKPSGKLALTNCRIITMEGDLVIENGIVVIQENRITAVGEVGKVSIPADAQVIDLKGKTLMPGMVDAHAHINAFRYGLTTQQNWTLLVNLAYGVTTVHDPSANTETIFTLSEMVKNGQLVGPRIYSTGYILYGADGDFKAVINSLEDARSHIQRTKAFGALSVKSYNQPRREQRQQVLQAARELGINVVPEGGSTFFHNLTMIIDGHTGVEHNLPVAPLYKDVIELWKRTSVGYTPTLLVNYGGLNAEYYWYQKTQVWEDEKLLTFTPRGIIDSRSRHRMMIPEEEYQNSHILTSQSATVLSQHGVKVNMGAHGQLQGLGAHWELWSIAQGGMSNLEALKTATIYPAEYIGAGRDIGSIQVGKLADILVLDQNPLEDIQHTNTLLYTIINGRIYDSNTMDQVGNHPKKRLPFYWENNRYNEAFPWHESSRSFMIQQCCSAGHGHQ